MFAAPPIGIAEDDTRWSCPAKRVQIPDAMPNGNAGMCANKSGNETHDRKPFRCLSKDLRVIGDARDSRFGQG